MEYVNPKGKGRHNIVSIGDSFTNNKGQEVTVKSLKSHKEITVVFEADGVEAVYEAGQLRKAMFNHPNRYSSVVGERYENKQGDWCTVVDYKARDDVTIVFDGYEDKPKKVWKSDLKKKAFKNVHKPSV